jgi:hypothetical protein
MLQGLRTAAAPVTCNLQPLKFSSHSQFKRRIAQVIHPALSPAPAWKQFCAIKINNHFFMQRRTSIAIAKTMLKTAVLCLVIAAGSLLFVSYKAEKMYADLWQQLGITKNDGTTQIRESFVFGYLQFYGARNIKKIAAGDRVAVAKDLLAFTKQYIQSEAFKKEYASLRSASKPIAPEPAKTEEQIKKERIQEMKDDIAKTEKAIKTVDPSMKKIFEDNLKMQQKYLKDFEDPNNKMLKMMVKSEQGNYEYKINRFKKDMERWEESTPENPMVLVKKRLQEVLEITKDVDFDAELTEKYGKKVFVNQAYERKHSNWKYAFRAGKEITGTVRAFAEKWISEIK